MRRSWLSLGLLLALAVPMVPTGEAHACVNTIGRTVEDDVRSLDVAGAHLDAGEYQDAVKVVLDVYPRAHRRLPDADDGLLTRGQRMLAVAVVRTGGAVRLGVHLRGKTAKQRHAALTWATGTLRRIHDERVHDGTVTAELAEALAFDPAARTQALGLLRSLGAEDLMPSARAWGVLAALERQTGAVAAAEQAQRRCAAIAGEPAVCAFNLPAA